MPIISAFFGIIIRMYFDDHEPEHFHAEHQGQNATFDFAGRRLTGKIRSATARKLIREWARAHETELEELEAGEEAAATQPGRSARIRGA